MGKKTAEERFMKNVHKDPLSGCWLWTGGEVGKGYGKFWFEGRSWRAHRWAYMTFVGDPGDLCVCHGCDTPACVNPDHLFLGTQTDNIQDAAAKGRMVRGDRHGSRTKPERRPRGENHRNAKLTSSDVQAIRDRYATGGVLQRALAAEYGVSKSLIGMVIHREIWVE